MKFQQLLPLLAGVVILALSELDFGDAVVLNLKKAGYKLLGKLDQVDSTTRGLRAITTFYFASDDLATHGQALQNCREDFSGQLVTPLNSIQINYIRQALDAAGQLTGEHFWTAGKKTSCERWYWNTTGKSISSLALNGNFADGHEDLFPSNRCLSLVGQLGNFGFCSTKHSACNNRIRYICEVHA